MKYAFLNRNFKKLAFEERLIFGAHLATVIFCFFPWISVEPLYEDPYWNSAMAGSGALLGAFIFLLSLCVVLIFADKILEAKRIKIPFNENYLFFVAGVEQLIFLILAWSVLIASVREFENAELRFGLLLCFLVQIVGLVASYLLNQNLHKKNTKDFFQHPDKHPAKKPEEKKEKIGGLFENNLNKDNKK